MSAEGIGKVSTSAAATTTFWLALAKVGRCVLSQLMAVAMSLAYACVVVRSTIMAHSILSTDLR
jgi:hypothetical protein